MIKIFFFLSRQTKQIQRIQKLTSIAPTYANLKKMNISLDKQLKAFDHLQTIHLSQSAKTVNNLLTYLHKVHKIKIKFNFCIDSKYHLHFELFISQDCDLLIKKSTEMNIKALSNCANSLAKIEIFKWIQN